METTYYQTINPPISFGQAVKHLYSKCFDFKGRARRSEFWWALLFITIVISTCFFSLCLVLYIFEDSLFSKIFFGIVLLFILFLQVPWLSLTIRRLHDIDKSDWWILVILIPFVGPIILLSFCLIDSKTGDNDWGVSPKYSMLEALPNENSKKINAWSYIWPILLLIESVLFFVYLTNGEEDFYIGPQLVRDADEIYNEFMYSQDPIDVARDSTYYTLKRYINSKIGTDFNISELDFSFVRYSLSFGEIDDAIFKVDDSRFHHELYVIGTVDARRVILDERHKYRLSGIFKEEESFNIATYSVGVVGRSGCLSFGMLRFEPLEVTENGNKSDKDALEDI